MTTEASDIDFGLEVSSAFLIRAVMYLIGFVGTIVFARILGPRDFGGYYLLLSIVLIGIRPVDGFATAIKKRFSETNAPRRELLGSHLLGVALLGLVGVVLVAIFGNHLENYSGLPSAGVLFLVLLLAVSFVESTMTVIEGTGRVSISNLVDLLGSVLTFPAQLGFVLLGFGAAGMAFGLASASAVTAVVGLFVIGIRPKVPSRQTVESLWKYARFSIFSSSVAKILSRVDILILGFFVGPVVAGQYEVALKLSLPAMFLSMVASSGLMARVSNFQSKQETEAIIVDLKNTLSITGLMAIPMFFGALALRGDIAVTVYGSEYAGASDFLALLILYQLVRTQASPVLNTINGIDRPETALRISTVTLLLNVLLGVGMFYTIGAVAVVVASVIAETFRYLTGAYLLSRHLPETELFPRTLLTQVAASIFMFVVVFAARTYVTVESWLSLLVLVGLGAIVYGSVLFCISKTQRRIAASVFGQFRSAIEARR